MNLPKNFKIEYHPPSLPYQEFNGEVISGVNEFPDGQIQFWTERMSILGYWSTLTCSLFTSRDLDLFIQIVNTLKFESITIKYLYGARCDKNKAGDHLVSNLPLIFVKIIENSFNPSSNTEYIFWNPHCELSILNKSIVIPLPREVKIYPFYEAIIYPDKSAFDRMNHLFPEHSSIVGNKKRDQLSGKIVFYAIPVLLAGEYLVVDDICDGGATFVNLRSQQDSDVIMDLYVTHGLFSKGLEPLAGYRKIWATDSCPGHEEVKKWTE